MLLNKKTFYLDHLGCAKNQVDSEIIIATLVDKGWQLVEASKAYVIIINSCGFIQSAKEESIDHFFSAKEHYKEAKIIFAGCMAQRYGEQLRELLPEANGIFGAGRPEQILEFIELIEQEDQAVWLPEACFSENIIRKNRLSFKGSTFIKIADGCSHGCRFCAIPMIRGRTVRSRPVASIVAEIEALLADGVVEFNLVAQDLAFYGRDIGQDINLMTLLTAIAKIDAQFWVRLLYIHPDYFPAGLLDLMAKDARFLPYFDLPFQHAAAKTLKNMGRFGSQERYLALIKEIKSSFPQATIRSTFLFGFPGESDADFAEAISFIERAKLTWAGAFTYSIEEDTAAYEDALNKDLAVDAQLAETRLNQFNLIQEQITTTELTKYIGEEQWALIEEQVEDSNFYLARSFVCAPEVDGLVVIEHDKVLKAGSLVKVLITGVTGVDFKATVIS